MLVVAQSDLWLVMAIRQPADCHLWQLHVSLHGVSRLSWYPPQKNCPYVVVLLYAWIVFAKQYVPLQELFVFVYDLVQLLVL